MGLFFGSRCEPIMGFESNRLNVTLFIFKLSINYYWPFNNSKYLLYLQILDLILVTFYSDSEVLSVVKLDIINLRRA